jgi:hypothetical protein
MRTTRATRAVLPLLAAGLIAGCSSDSGPGTAAGAPTAGSASAAPAQSPVLSAEPSPSSSGFGIEPDSEAEKVFGRDQVEQALRFVNETVIVRTLTNATLIDPEPDSAEEIVATADDLLTSSAREHLAEGARVYPEGDPNPAATLLFIVQGNDQVSPKEPYVFDQKTSDWAVDVDEEGRLAVFLRAETDYLADVSGKTEVQRQRRDIGYYLLPQPEGADQPWLIDGWGAEVYGLEKVK